MKSKQYVECDRCSSKILKASSLKQKGLRVCSKCFDSDEKHPTPNMRWGSPRANSLTTTAVITPTVFSITAAGGITPSHSLDSETTQRDTTFRVGAHFYMKIVGSGGPIDITAVPQITAGIGGDMLTLEGTDDTNTVQLDNANGIWLSGNTGSLVLGFGDIISFVYVGNLWWETSRN